MNLHNARQRVLLAIKIAPGGSIATMADELGFSYETVRQQVSALEREGWIRGEQERPVARVAGRPLARYYLTVAGEHLFPKHYDVLANTLIGTAVRAMGEGVVQSLLASITLEQVRRWRPVLEGLSLEEKLTKLKDLYQKEDPYIEVEHGTSELRLIERNCPFLSTAMEHPQLCSVSVSTLRSLLGFHVEREERFQSGHGRCVFRIDLTRLVEGGARGEFAIEDDGSCT